MADVDKVLLDIGLPNKLIADISDTAQLDIVTAEVVKQLGEKKAQAVISEEYDEAKRLKKVIDSLIHVGKKITVLELQKKMHVIDEDYAAAGRVKHDLDAIIEQREAILQYITDGERDARRDASGKGDSRATPLGNSSNAPFMPVIFKDSLEMATVPPAPNNIVSPDINNGAVHMVHTAVRECGRAQTIGPPRPPNPPLTAAAHKCCLLLEKNLGDYLAACTFSPQWKLRKVLFEQFERHLRVLHAPEVRSHLKVLKLSTVLLFQGLTDMAPEVYASACHLLSTVHEGRKDSHTPTFGSHLLRPEDLAQSLEAVWPLLLDRCASNQNVLDEEMAVSAVHTIVFLCYQLHIGPTYISHLLTRPESGGGQDDSSELVKSHDKTLGRGRRVIGKLKVLKEIILLFGKQVNATTITTTTTNTITTPPLPPPPPPPPSPPPMS